MLIVHVLELVGLHTHGHHLEGTYRTYLRWVAGLESFKLYPRDIASANAYFVKLSHVNIIIL